jgi:hypothetical protein
LADDARATATKLTYASRVISTEPSARVSSTGRTDRLPSGVATALAYDLTTHVVPVRPCDFTVNL